MSNPTIDEDGHKRWFNDKGERHRLDGPAIEWVDGYKFWYNNGEYIYRLDSDGRAYKGDMRNIPEVMKQSIIEHTLKLQS
jgi:hypothetical protein